MLRQPLGRGTTVDAVRHVQIVSSSRTVKYVFREEVRDQNLDHWFYVRRRSTSCGVPMIRRFSFSSSPLNRDNESMTMEIDMFSGVSSIGRLSNVNAGPSRDWRFRKFSSVMRKDESAWP
ncbi:hypothetical protein J7T55_012278 [Diaporthe amygdali]|uniref:uncharacterized protein n=1 Tax=Phomopsis amygdali TaxID=1214568 RepID=UPI0022FEA095|nr:uncharacterized protein J7T55_012278 [Diaporthe amygdali]KAJ0123808.1 hypothetical protein J7T55_012278 [Diaporthe amygdali]